MMNFLSAIRYSLLVKPFSFCLSLISLMIPALLSAQETTQTSKSSVLLMSTGRILSGEIGESAGGYFVKNPAGNILVPYDSVLFEAKDLHELYVKQRNSMKFPTANTHIELARWCITNKLFEEAKAELRDAIRLEPKRSEPQLMLRRLAQPSANNQPTVEEKIKETILKKQLSQSEEATSLTGISREQSAIFVRKIQPILLNKCGNANCHGSAAKSEFRLTQVSRRYGNHRIYAEKNLAEVMKWIDLDEAARSQLLVKPEQEHPQQGMVVFTGYAGRKQRQLIQQWVGEVVADRLKQDQLRADRLTRRAQRRKGQARENLLEQAAALQSDHSVQRAKMEVDQTPLKGDISLIGGFEPKKLSDEQINELVKPKPEDPFDPALFNNAVPPAKP